MMGRLRLRVIALVLLAFGAIGLAGCQMLVPMGIPGSGVSATEVRDVADFERIQLSGVGKVSIRFGEQPSVAVTTDDNLLEYLKTDVVDGVLKIRFTENINAKSKIEFDIIATELVGLSCSGSGSFEIEGLDGDTFQLTMSGATSGRADGKVQSLGVNLSGAGSLDLKELEATSAKVRVSGAGSVSVYADSKFDGSVSGVGAIDVYGEPEDVSRSVSGVGKINIKNSK